MGIPEILSLIMMAISGAAKAKSAVDASNFRHKQEKREKDIYEREKRETEIANRENRRYTLQKAIGSENVYHRTPMEEPFKPLEAPSTLGSDLVALGADTVGSMASYTSGNNEGSNKTLKDIIGEYRQKRQNRAAARRLPFNTIET